MSQVLIRSLFPCCVSVGCFPCLFSKSSPNVLQALSQSSRLTFDTPEFKPYWLQELKKFSPFHFPSQLLWGFIFLVWVLLCTSLFFWLSLWLQLPSYFGSHDQFLSQTTSLHFLPSLTWSLLYPLLWSLFCQSLGRFLGYLGWLDSYLVVFMGQGVPRVILPHCHLHLPNNPLILSQPNWDAFKYFIVHVFRKGFLGIFSFQVSSFLCFFFCTYPKYLNPMIVLFVNFIFYFLFIL